MRIRRFLSVLFFAGAAVALPTMRAGATGTTTTNYPAWTPPLLLHGGGAEPSIRTSPDQRYAAYISAPAASGSNFWNVREIKRSDGSVVFKSSPVVDPDLGTGGGDSEISVANAVDPTTGCAPIAYSGLHNIDIFDNFTVATSKDCGVSWSLSNQYGTQNTLTDRQWQTFDGAKTNFLIYHKVDTSQIVVSRSFDGGMTYLSSSPTGTGLEGGGIIDPATFPAVANTNQVGNIVTDYSHPIAGLKYPVSNDQVHTLYATFGGPHDVNENLAANSAGAGNTGNYNHVDTVYLAKSVDGGQTWHDTMVYTTPPATQRELNMLFPVVAVDKVGNVYVMWSDTYRIQYAVSTDGGKTFSNAYQVNRDVPAGSVTPVNGKANLFPWLAAGADGMIDLVWYHGEGGNTIGYRDPGSAGQTKWRVAYAQLFQAHRTDASRNLQPDVRALNPAVTPVIHTGDVCLNGTFCGITGPGDRTLLDFFQVAIDRQGRANIAYVTDVDTPGTATVAYTRQNAGLSALDGKPVPNLNVVPNLGPQGTSCPGPQVMDVAKDATSRIIFPPAQSTDPNNPNNVDSADILNVRFTSPYPDVLRVKMTVANLSETPPGGSLNGQWEVEWVYRGVKYYAMARSYGPTLQDYDAGTLASGTFSHNSTGTPTGKFVTGENGSITWDIPTSMIGHVQRGTQLTGLFAKSLDGYQAPQAGGVYYDVPIDQAPDAGSGAPYTIGAC